jgi:adenine-specific DNA-methyltransferase
VGGRSVDSREKRKRVGVELAYRYLGNKTRLLGRIVDLIAEHVPAGATVADPMCGTAAVSEALALEGYNVRASDALTFPVLHAKARLLKGVPAFRAFGGYESAIEHLNTLTPIKGYFWREFSPDGAPTYGGPARRYFTTDNAMRIDAVRTEIKRLRTVERITLDEHDLLLHNLALAVNDVANITGTYGYFRASWNEQALRPLELIPETFLPTDGTHVTFQADAVDAVRRFTGDAIYLDPPYTKRQYGGNYHIPETIAMGDQPIANGAGGLRNWQKQASDFCYRRKAPGAFRAILDASTAPHIFISYSEDGQVPSDALHSLLSRYGKVERFEFTIPRFRSNARTAEEGVTEHLYHLERQ